MTDVPVKQTGDTVTATEWNAIPTDIEELEDGKADLVHTHGVADLTDLDSSAAGQAAITAIETSHSEAGLPAAALRLLVADVIDQMEDTEVNTILDRINAQTLADRTAFVAGILSGQVGTDEIVATDSAGEVVGIPLDIVDSASLGDLAGNWTAASSASQSKLVFDEDTDNGVHTATLQAPASLAASVTITLPSSTGTLAISGEGLDEWNAASSSGPSSLEFFEDTDNGTSKITLTGQASLASDIAVTLPATAGTLLTAESASGSYQPLAAALTDLADRWTVASASTAAALDFREDTDNGSNRVRLIGATSTADVTVTLPAKTGTVLTTAGETLSAGFDATSFNAGTKSSGTYTPAASDGNFQHAVNGGAHTLAPPTSSCCIVIQYTNNASAGAITTSGFTMVTGDSFTTTDGHDFLCHITRCNGFHHLHVTALQ